jgi:hypothetical protein
MLEAKFQEAALLGQTVVENDMALAENSAITSAVLADVALLRSEVQKLRDVSLGTNKAIISAVLAEIAPIKAEVSPIKAELQKLRDSSLGTNKAIVDAISAEIAPLKLDLFTKLDAAVRELRLTTASLGGMSVTPAPEGTIEGVSAGQICGWALDQRLPDLPVTVSVTYQDRRIGTGYADQLRGEGRPSCGFAIRLPKQYCDGLARRMRVQIEGLNYELAGSPILVMVPPSS